MNILIAMFRPFWPQRFGGLESSTRELAAAFVDKGHNVAIFCRIAPTKPHGLSFTLRQFQSLWSPTLEQMDDGVTVLRSSMPQMHISWIRRWIKPDVAIVQSPGHMFGIKAFEKLNAPKVLHLRDPEFRKASIPLKAERIVANSDYTANVFYQKYNQKAEVLRNVYKKKLYKTKRTGHVIGFINPVPQKGVDVALELARQNPDIPFLFLKAWPLSRKYERMLHKRIACIPNVELHNRTHNMQAIYERIKILIVPSQCDEAWGRVVTEAQMSGIPVIASNRGGLPEAVGKGGVILPYDDFDSWNDTLRKFYFDKRLYESLSQLAKARTEQQDLNETEIVDRYLEILCHVSYRGF